MYEEMRGKEWETTWINCRRDRQCLALAEAALARGLNVAVDRTNVSVQQRAAFLNIARPLGVPATSLHFDFPVAECIARALSRGAGHPTLKPESVSMVCRIMKVGRGRRGYACLFAWG